jgi:acyl-CoA dehydrogenase
MARYKSPWMDAELEVFRKSVRQFIQEEFAPHDARWRAQHHVDREAWTKAGGMGMLLADVPEEHGGGGGTFAHECVVAEELSAAGITSLGHAIQSIVAHYILAYGSAGQQRAWLPAMASGERVAALAMTEPAAGSDLQGIRTTAIRQGDTYVVNGSKTFITNGYHANLVCVAAKTNPALPGSKGTSLVMLETNGLDGYRVGRTLEKLGQHGQDTCELFFDDVRVPAANLLGAEEGRGFAQMMQQLPYERTYVAIGAVAAMERAVAITTRHARERRLFGQTLFDLQHARFTLADCETETRIARVFLDHCIGRVIDGTMDTTTASMAKWWLTDRQFDVADRCLQLFGGYGYTPEYEIARLWADSRVQRIYAGANEVMKELIARSL